MALIHTPQPWGIRCSHVRVAFVPDMVAKKASSYCVATYARCTTQMVPSSLSSFPASGIFRLAPSERQKQEGRRTKNPEDGKRGRVPLSLQEREEKMRPGNSLFRRRVESKNCPLSPSFRLLSLLPPGQGIWFGRCVDAYIALSLSLPYPD